MGLFDNLFGGSGSKELSRPEAFAGILLCAVASDGHISGEEAQQLFTTLSRMKMFENWTSEKFNSMINRMIGMLKRQGVEPLLEKCATIIPEELHDTAFANACDLVLADGGIEDEEKDFIDKLSRALGIPGDQAISIVEVMVIKNRG